LISGLSSYPVTATCRLVLEPGATTRWREM
jgi:hypothetical protein